MPKRFNYDAPRIHNYRITGGIKPRWRIGNVGCAYVSDNEKNVALRNESTIIVNALRTAQYRSIVSQDNYTHGVHFDTDRLTVYGNTWSNPVNPEVHLFSNGVVVTQGIGSDAVFSRLIGSSTPQVISIGYPGGTISTITISGAGAISNL